MNIFNRFINSILKGGAKLGMTQSLGSITDDSRINIDPEEYERINKAIKYYRDDFEKVTYKNTYGVKRTRDLLSINVTKMAAHRLATVIFNEQCTITIDDEPNNELLADVFEDNDFYNQYEEKLEPGIALGGFAIRPYVEDDKIKLAWVRADQFYPLNSNTNEITEAAIASVTTKIESHAPVYYTLLEFHQWDEHGSYQITNELYRSTNATTVGNQVPLSSIDEYADLAPQVTLNGLSHPLFAYFRAPGANNITPSSPLGLGLVDNSHKIVDAINATHDQFVWEVKMGQRRVAVPAEMLRRGNSFGDNNASDNRQPVFDADENVFVQMYGDDMDIKDLTTPIRNDQYQASMDFFLKEFENAVGISQGTFTATPSGIQTATEVVTNNSMTYQTRSSYLTQVTKQVNALIIAIFELMQCGQLFSDGKPRFSGDVDDLQITIDYADGVFTDKTTQFTQDSQAVAMGVMPKKRFLMRNFGLDEDVAEQWLEELDEEMPELDPGSYQGTNWDDGD
ncbi:minor structural protein gp61 [Limosilactobacillus equigenerosi DSM 18793 = JCM 14505]|uniref:Minor structural protein gp61 n=2 Tax=Limosilactobacillus TaxID=2742598 RepID=A0A0R1UM27_9LACO|nr:minor structural protein gp61 [Limosilactobacillus equigenerosi DSM 18793 = JCM 14505]